MAVDKLILCVNVGITVVWCFCGIAVFELVMLCGC